MSLANVFNDHSRGVIHLLVDSAVIADGKYRCGYPKSAVLPEVRAAMAVRGSALACLAMSANVSAIGARSVGELRSRIGPHLSAVIQPDIDAAVASGGRRAELDFEVIVGGFDSAEQPVMFVVGNHNGSGCVPWEVRDLPTGVFSPPISKDKLASIWGEDPLDGVAAIIAEQRRQQPIIGGHVELVTIGPRLIERRVYGVWPDDRIGEMLDPEARFELW